MFIWIIWILFIWNIDHNSIGKKPVDANYSAMSEKIETKSKSSKFKVDDRVRITKSTIFLAKVTLKVGCVEN